MRNLYLRLGTSLIAETLGEINKGGVNIEDKKIKYRELLGFGGTFVLIASIVYILGYSSVIKFDVIKYFRVEDYLNFSVKAFLPVSAGFLPGFLFGYFSPSKSKNNSEKKYDLVVITVFLLALLSDFLPIISEMSTENAKFIRTSIIATTLFIVIKDRKLKMNGIRRDVLAKVSVLILVISYGIGAYGAINLMNFSNTKSTSLVVTSSNEEIEGISMFALSEFFIIYQYEKSQIVVVPNGEIKKIIE